MNIDYNAIGLRIRKLRCQKLWTQEKLAEKADIAPDYLCRIELGKKRPSLRSILLIAEALDTTVDDLLIDVQKKNICLDKNQETNCDSEIIPSRSKSFLACLMALTFCFSARACGISILYMSLGFHISPVDSIW